MKGTKKKRLKAAGWRVGSAREFLGLTKEEAAMVEIRLAFARNLKARRVAGRLAQLDLAKRIGSSQSRVAKMEAADASVSIDLLIRSLLALGATRREIGRVLAAGRSSRAA